MNNQDIRNILNQYNYNVPKDLYLQIIDSPQIDHIIFECEYFNMWDMNGEHFKFKVRE